MSMADDDWKKGLLIAGGIALGLIALKKILESMEDEEDDR
jgi:small neutral amino acid transporter SnatA (MarC family)